MEAVAAQAVLLIIFVGNGIGVCLGGHGLVESGVKDDDHRDLFAEDLAAGAHGDEAGGVVQRGEVREVVDGLHDLVVNQHRLGEFFSAVDAAVADGRNFRDVVNNLVLAGGQQVHNLGKSLGMGREVGFVFDFGAGGELVADKAAGSDPFAVALGNDLFILHIDELILHRGAARVDDKNLHGSLEPPLTFCTVREKNAAKRRYFLTGIFLSSIILYNFQKFKWK